MYQNQTDRFILQQKQQQLNMKEQVLNQRSSLNPERKSINHQQKLQALSNQFSNMQKSTNQIVQEVEQQKLVVQNSNDYTLQTDQEYKFMCTVPNVCDPDDYSCIIEQTEELGGLYLGNYQGAQNVELLRRLKIRAVLTASIETAVKYDEEIIHFHEIIQAHDKKDYDIRQHFDQAFDFIDRNRKFTNVFVHCFLGISRSASLVIQYLMRKYNYGFEKSLWMVKSKRRQVCPNAGFVKQLFLFDQMLESNQQQQLNCQLTSIQQSIKQQSYNQYPHLSYAQYSNKGEKENNQKVDFYRNTIQPMRYSEYQNIPLPEQLQFQQQNQNSILYLQQRETITNNNNNDNNNNSMSNYIQSQYKIINYQ